MGRHKGYNDVRPDNWPADGLTQEQLTKSLFEHVEADGMIWHQGKAVRFRGRITHISSNAKTPKKFSVVGVHVDGFALSGDVWID